MRLWRSRSTASHKHIQSKWSEDFSQGLLPEFVILRTTQISNLELRSEILAQAKIRKKACCLLLNSPLDFFELISKSILWEWCAIIDAYPSCDYAADTKNAVYFWINFEPLNGHLIFSNLCLLGDETMSRMHSVPPKFYTIWVNYLWQFPSILKTFIFRLLVIYHSYENKGMFNYKIMRYFFKSCKLGLMLTKMWLKSIKSNRHFSVYIYCDNIYWQTRKLGKNCAFIEAEVRNFFSYYDLADYACK